MLPTVMLAALLIGGTGCKKDSSSPTQPPTTTPQLTAVPPSASVGVGASQIVTISGGRPPYTISGPPTSSATASLAHPESVVTTLTITGVTVASTSTSVTVDDSASSKKVTIPITVH